LCLGQTQSDSPDSACRVVPDAEEPAMILARQDADDEAERLASLDGRRDIAEPPVSPPGVMVIV